MTEGIPQDTAQRNLVARCDLMQALQGTNGLITCYVRFNITPSTAPVVQFEAGAGDQPDASQPPASAGGAPTS
jgi:hypothetical protein